VEVCKLKQCSFLLGGEGIGIRDVVYRERPVGIFKAFWVLHVKSRSTTQPLSSIMCYGVLWQRRSSSNPRPSLVWTM
jgi:hypothetical protein